MYTGIGIGRGVDALPTVLLVFGPLEPALEGARKDWSGPGAPDLGGSFRLREGLADDPVRSINSAGLPNNVCCFDSFLPVLVFVLGAVDLDMDAFFVPTAFRCVKHISH